MERIEISKLYEKSVSAAMRRAKSRAEKERARRVDSGLAFREAKKHIPELKNEPDCGWQEYCYRHVLGELFPHMVGSGSGKKRGAKNYTYKEARFSKGCEAALKLLHELYLYEREILPFDPTRDIEFLTDSEFSEYGQTSEYIKLRKLVRSNFVYEFMRIGADMTPFNTIGHIAGVHYVATYVARQLHDAGIPVDVALVSGAAAAHDIGKYGCRKDEEARIPYLHYYYTNYCLNRFGLPTIAHIAANHSTWDLELENLSAESLILIYADFRVRSSRTRAGEEKITFHSLEDAFNVILSKLDNVDSAKKKRYEKVYAKLVDFEKYMKLHGVTVELFEDVGKPVAVKREVALMYGDEIIEHLKQLAVDHNIKLMSHFNSSDEFVNLLEAVRSETNWRNIRTYITILGDYSTYMTEEQKSVILELFYERLTHRASDIREQAASQMGRMIAGYREEYKKELPHDIPAQEATTKNIEMFERYVDRMLNPSKKLAEQHRQRIIQSVDFFVGQVIENVREDRRYLYLDILSKFYRNAGSDELELFSLLSTLHVLSPELCTEKFIKTAVRFCNRVIGTCTRSTDLLALTVKEHYLGDPDEVIKRQRYDIMGIPNRADDYGATMSAMFLQNLKFQTRWVDKLANIRFMMDIAGEVNQSELLHIATHFANLIKVSETITVRMEAGRALIKLIGSMQSDQRNEIMIELFNGLEIHDYQFSRFVPNFLGIILLYLDADEYDEGIGDLVKLINAGNDRTTAAALTTMAIALENYDKYSVRRDDPDRIARRLKLLNILVKGYAYYDDAISQEAFRIIGEHIFSSDILSMAEKRELVCHFAKRLATLIPENGSEKTSLEFYNNAAVLNRIYRYISEYENDFGAFQLPGEKKIAFFPGTFDPFSLGHKAIAKTIRDNGFSVYLALDEFSWSKKTLPHMARRELLSMSIADEENLYIFPDDIPINIANPSDISVLKKMFRGKELYIAVGSDVVENASAYKSKAGRNTIHSLNHIIFERETREAGPKTSAKSKDDAIKAKVVRLTLARFYEDISSTRIRDNIDLGRDISTLLDPIVQNYIYENNYYARQPAYKHELQAREINIGTYEHENFVAAEGLKDELIASGYNYAALHKYMKSPRVRTVSIETVKQSGSSKSQKRSEIAAFASARRVERHDLLGEFEDPEITSYIRDHANGAIGVIGAIYVGRGRSISNLSQILLTELMSDLLAKDYGYIVYHPIDPAGMNPKTVEVLERQGFINIAAEGASPVYAVDITSPIVIFKDVETVIKPPFDKNPRVTLAIENAHNRLLKTFAELYPGKLVLSFNTSAVYSKIVDLVAAENGVSTVPDPKRARGPYMAVPFGKALSDVVVPNTVTKAMRTEKYFNNSITGFTIRERFGYSNLDDQARTLKSFGRQVILIDDLLHSGQRMNIIDPLLRKYDVDVRKIIVGLLTGNARDNMNVSERAVEGAYFIPSILMWLNERDSYPFIGGDSIDPPGYDEQLNGQRFGVFSDAFENSGNFGSINLIMPYTSFNFVGKGDSNSVYKYSMTCLENARDILRVLEREYQAEFGKKLTLRRLGAVITYPRRPELGTGLFYDENIEASAYIENAILDARRLNMVKK